VLELAEGAFRVNGDGPGTFPLLLLSSMTTSNTLGVASFAGIQAVNPGPNQVDTGTGYTSKQGGLQGAS